MRRRDPTATGDRGHPEVQHAWDSSMAAVRGIVRQAARDGGCSYERPESEYRGGDAGHVWGQQV